MAGKKFRKDKNEVRYHRVDLGEDDDSDDQSKLSRALGPPKTKKKNCGKITRGIFITCTLLLTLAGLVSVVTYTAIMFPEGPTKQFNSLYNRVFGAKGYSNSTNIENSTTTNNDTLVANVTTSPTILVPVNTTNKTLSTKEPITDGESNIDEDVDNAVSETEEVASAGMTHSLPLLHYPKITFIHIHTYIYLYLYIYIRRRI